MASYDSGEFRQRLLEDDIHTANQKAVGLSSRAEAKRFIYAYYAGAEILNSVKYLASLLKAKE